MAEPRGVGHSPFTQAQIDTIINKIETGKPLSREEAVPLIRLIDKINSQARLVEGELQMILKLVYLVTKGQTKMDKIMDKAMSGQKFSNNELLGMQEGVYRFSQELELTAKVVEKATSGVRETMHSQI